MRFSLVSVALVALAQSVVPGVHGAPAPARNHVDSLAVRQDPIPLLGSLLGPLLDALGSIVGVPDVLQSQLAEFEQVLQQLQGSASAVTSLLPRAPAPSSNAILSTLGSLAGHTSSSLTTTTTTNVGSAGASSALSSTPQASRTPPTRMRRQLPSSRPASVPSPLPSIVSSSSAVQPLASVSASKFESSKSAASKTTSSTPSSSASHV